MSPTAQFDNKRKAAQWAAFFLFNRRPLTGTF